MKYVWILMLLQTAPDVPPHADGRYYINENDCLKAAQVHAEAAQRAWADQERLPIPVACVMREHRTKSKGE